MKLRKFNHFLYLGLLICGIIFTAFIIAPDNDPLSGWDKNELQQANTATNANYMTDLEKKIIFYTNLSRLNPKKFGENILENYVKQNSVESSSSLTSLRKELSKGTPLIALSPDKDLYDVAHAFAVKMGKEGKTGHEGFQERMKKVLLNYNIVGENCSYGDTAAIDCVMRLLIDTSDPTHLQHRKNMLDPKFTLVGVSNQPHKVFKWNIVMDFAGKENQ